MNYIVISPYYPENFQPFTIELAKKGITVLGIGQEPYDQLGPDLQGALTEYFRVENLEDIDEVKRAVAFLFYKHGPIDRIESHNEYWLENDAALREQFNIFGAKSANLKKTKFKSEMKKYFSKAGVPVVPGMVVKTEKDIEKAVKSIGFPILAKPDNGVGASGTFKLTKKADLETFKEAWDGQTVYFFEKFVHSSMITTYDGLIDSKGKVVFETGLTYVHTPFELLQSKKDNAYYIEKELDPKLVEYGHAIIKAFGMKERFFHIEFFKNGKDYIAIEYNNRMAGGFTVEGYNYAHSIDLFRDYANVVTGGEVEERRFDAQYCLVVTRRDTTDYVHSANDIHQKFADRIKTVKRMPEAFAELQGNDAYLLVTESKEELDEMVDFIGLTK
ncbi:carbamoyl phosphate synthase large subunit [Streptococcus azizii]|uniref:Carbamoyl phosphate synthase large subunit n=1 Tax=Streptococcus azizii TaxID=1579424 RepID=A0AB36JQ44_9STRE|nr:MULTISPECIES: ATP-grasp domain-containing protein [Streptococcus]MBF0776113.1 ATP-grasp domain-containing protein [Streptococcus sp. 19428wD3_AN2]ONK26888.1 carbamoyl phosphate synthase large subunit [Streptococcus azizii]ONK27910.1 carbamoyl phosphate synthase large subunit [Streptococcus azizii]ONK28754.1 carbamoyl phosphate synthase large subunit [Streptococcus azizii]TFU83458.1 ATP-grasp domain-containing protein [Streptococcus sp. AN2]